ncbi:SMI1/KNR4 family protein [Streptomyces sp. Qhu_M48]|uniref:SMI1/KNR4 family protein n=1 Tax=Streptomyces sp. Qhu_M48 TaxID=3435889 RepID=UPI003F508741
MTNGLARLSVIVPAPSEPRQKNWDEVERMIGLELPADYKEFIHVYGGSNWDDYLYVLEPGCPNENYDFLEWAEHQPEDLQDLWEFEKKPAELEVEGSQVIPWATTDNGECLYWLVRPGLDPNQWAVMVNEVRGSQWEHFSVSCTQFLASTLTGEVRSEILSSSYPLSAHEFRRLQTV